MERLWEDLPQICQISSDDLFELVIVCLSERNNNALEIKTIQKYDISHQVQSAEV